MGEGLLSRGFGGTNTALVKILTYPNAPVSIQNLDNGENFSTYSDNNGNIEINLEYGKWKFLSTNPEETDTVIINTQVLYIDKSQVYNIYLRDIYSFGISIDMSQSDPTAAVTYFDSAEGMEPLSVNLDTGVCNYGGWEKIITEVFGCTPCCCIISTDGGETTLNSPAIIPLNPDNYEEPLYDIHSEFEVDKIIKNNHDTFIGNVMVAFKKTWYKYSVKGNILTFEVANYDRSSDGFVCSAFKSMDGTGEIKDYMLYSAYEGYNDGEFLRSISGVDCFNEETLLSNGFEELGKRINIFGIEDWCKRCYILGLLMLVTKTRDLQSVLGYGYVVDTDPEEGEYIFLKTGTMDESGLFYGRRANTSLYDGENHHGVKVFGIENFWGNYGSYFNGISYNFITNLAFFDSPPYSASNSNVDYSLSSSTVLNGCLCPTSMTTILDGAGIFPVVGQSDDEIGWTDYATVALGGMAGAGYVLPFAMLDDYGSEAVNVIGPFSIEVGSGNLCYKYYKEYITSRTVGAGDAPSEEDLKKLLDMLT